MLSYQIESYDKELDYWKLVTEYLSTETDAKKLLIRWQSKNPTKKYRINEVKTIYIAEPIL